MLDDLDEAGDTHPRITKGTGLTERQKTGLDQLRVGLHILEDAGQRGDQFVLAGKVAILSSIVAGVLPQPFGGIEFGRVGRELVDFQPVPVGFEPAPDLGVLMVRGVVLNENGPAATVMRG